MGERRSNVLGLECFSSKIQANKLPRPSNYRCLLKAFVTLKNKQKAPGSWFRAVSGAAMDFFLHPQVVSPVQRRVRLRGKQPEAKEAREQRRGWGTGASKSDAKCREEPHQVQKRKPTSLQAAKTGPIGGPGTTYKHRKFTNPESFEMLFDSSTMLSSC